MEEITLRNGNVNGLYHNRLENISYKIKTNGSYVLVNPSTLANLLKKDIANLNRYLNSQRGNLGVKNPFTRGQLSGSNISKVRIVGNRPPPSPAKNLTQLMANMRFTTAPPPPNAAALAAAERNSRNALQLLLEAAIAEFRKGINSGNLPVNKLKNGSHLNGYIRSRGMIVPGNNQQMIEMAKIAYNGSRRGMVNRTRSARTAVSARQAINEARNALRRTLF